MPFDLLVDAVQEYAIFMLDSDGRIASWNRGATRIKGYTAAEVLGRPLSTFYTAEDVAAGELVERIARAGLRMREMLDGVRAWSRVGAGAQDMGDVDLGALAAAVVSTLQPSLSQRGVEVVCDDLPGVRGDGRQLGQVLQNLIGNAVKFGATRVEVSAARENGAWVISVTDDGPGIPPERAEEIFGMFSRLDTEAGVPGSGIGLAIAARVLERHGGRIWVEGRPGDGSVFRFSLPPEPAA